MSQQGSNWLLYGVVFGAAAIGTGIVLDYIRRSDPNYKNKIRQRRKNASKGTKDSNVKLPSINPENPSEIQALFMQEVQIGEECMSVGKVEEGIDHIAVAVNLCGYPQQLLQVFQQTFPPEHFEKLIERIPVTRELVKELFGESTSKIEEITEKDEIPEVKEDVESIESNNSIEKNMESLNNGSFGLLTEEKSFTILESKDSCSSGVESPVLVDEELD
ncbi:TOMM20-like protein 1 [Strongyloides ratti]|uniref:TOMM20-like protein 1 n=1 Tax=Strongyloides ratti TaxID=34506 RepID=A0A090LNJ6_STRRB|nr:TOMM20-like protein 1 [Strongyloides ratti]CEF69724.1 TOMM20-like protein 1 [Strongyloides ratti]